MLEKNQKIKIRTIIELLGKPQDHIVKTMKLVIAKIKGEEGMNITSEHIAETTPQEELFSIFSELEIEIDTSEKMIYFVFQYMPSVIELLEPKHLEFSARDFTSFLTEIQARLHSVDAKVKMINQDRTNLSNSLIVMAKNNLINVLRLGGSQGLTKDVLTKYTGIAQKDLDQFLKILKDEGKVLQEGNQFKIDMTYKAKF